MKSVHVAIAAFLVCLLGMGTLRMHQLEHRNEVLENELREVLRSRSRCEPVQVTCTCPDYEEGWEDAQYVDGCDPAWDEMSADDLRLICSELETYGYVPSC